MNVLYKNKKELFEAIIDKNFLVLDVGFWGQGVNIDNPNWVHSLLRKKARQVFGIDLEFDEKKLGDSEGVYFKQSAESFDIGKNFDIIFAGDLIEHLSNPGLFLQSALRHSNKDTKLVITTPNCFNLFNLTEKISKQEPTVNSDHTSYFNSKTISQLMNKNDWQVISVDYIYTLDVEYKESWKKRFINVMYWIISKFTNKYLETLVVTAVKKT